jgi:DNA-binding winged helix-turn-helix (wHTH) protein
VAAAHIEKRFIPRQLQSIEQSIARVGLAVSNLGLKIKMLVDSAGEVVTREEIRRTLWPNDTVRGV